MRMFICVMLGLFLFEFFSRMYTLAFFKYPRSISREAWEEVLGAVVDLAFSSWALYLLIR